MAIIIAVQLESLFLESLFQSGRRVPRKIRERREFEECKLRLRTGGSRTTRAREILKLLTMEKKRKHSRV